ncbi:hypothetical protein MVEG_00251 [Podila verticillata NRRL 6337]|nr:hypothetical protein MVEG_00251 [Podila verticillata NRRL 6337]
MHTFFSDKGEGQDPTQSRKDWAYGGCYDCDCEAEGDDQDIEIYGDFSVRPRVPPLSRARHRHTTYTTRKFPSEPLLLPAHSTAFYSPSLRTPLKHIPDPIVIPTLPVEVLHIIFSSLDNTTLCQGISLASRWFHAIAKCYIERKGLWTLGSQKDEDNLLRKMRLGQVNVLQIKYSSSNPRRYMDRIPPFDTWDYGWRRFRDSITEPIQGSNCNAVAQEACSLMPIESILTTHDGKDRATPPCLLHHMKKLTITGGDLWTPGGLPAILPYMQSMRTLELHSQCSPFPLLPILEACPNLDSLAIGGYVLLCSKAPFTSTTISSPSSSYSTNQPRRTFQLSRLVTKHTTFTYSIMAELLSTCPRLMTFQALQVHIRPDGSDLPPMQHRNGSPSLSIEPLIRRAVFLCPNLVDLSIVPENPCSDDNFALELRLTAELFPQITHIEKRSFLNPDRTWRPDPAVAQFLAQLTRFSVLEEGHSYKTVNRLLKHTPGLTHLIATVPGYNCPEAEYLQDRQDRIDDAMVHFRLHRNRCALKKERQSRWEMVPISENRTKKLMHTCEKRILRLERWEHRYMDPRSGVSWRCLHLRVVDLKLADQYQLGIFRYLTYACPNVQTLTLRMELKVGQANNLFQLTYYPVYSTGGKVCTTRSRRSKWCKYEEERIEGAVCWTNEEDTLWALGSLNKLEVLEVKCRDVRGVLCPSNFEFMRTVNFFEDTPKQRKVFCPRLKELRVDVSSWQGFQCGLVKEEPLEDKTVFVNALRSMRPGVWFEFSHSYSPSLVTRS